MDSQRNSSKASPSDLPGGRDSQQFSPALETSFASIQLIASLAGLAVFPLVCVSTVLLRVCFLIMAGAEVIGSSLFIG